MENRLFEKSIATLELGRVLEQLAAQAYSVEAKERARTLTPLTDMREVEELQEETDAAYLLLGSQGTPSFIGVKDVSASLLRARQSGMLNTRELLDIAALLRAARRVRDYRGEESDRTTVLDQFFSVLHGNRYLEKKITHAIIDENEIADDASTELSDIRRKIRIAGAKSRQILQKIISSPTYAKALQENLVTQRDGRYVVPVKSEFRSEIPGLVHDVSASGATVFVEPMGVVQANNALKELELKEKQEIERILSQLSAEVSSCSEEIQREYRILVQLDLIFARGNLSYQMNATRPKISNDGHILLHRARHPLLEKTTAVPIDIELGGAYDTLIITGPNTGGKTVSLKTLGLLTLMAQCGLHIPSNSGSCVSVFKHIMADIGDEQSIAQNLSTFSAHMVNIVKILNEADASSLILLDELGAGTDPVEGAALAIAIISEARERGARVAATTHYAELKTFAMTTEGIENASCEFDVQTLRPTFRLLTGIPGKSNAFAIARRLGLENSVIERAKTQINGETVRFEDILAHLEKQRQAMEQDRTEAAKLRLAAEQDAEEARIYREKLENAHHTAREKAEREAREILEDARNEANRVFAKLNKMRADAKRPHDVQVENQERSELMRGLKAAEGRLYTQALPQQPRSVSEHPIQVGDTVELLGLKTRAHVLAIKKDGVLQLEAGAMKISAKPEEVRRIQSSEKTPKVKVPRRTRQRTVLPSRPSASMELDIRGMTGDEAAGIVDRFLDDAVMGHLEQATIIHGKGTGALRKAVHEQLKRHPYVRAFRLGAYGEGEDGVTVVELK